MSVPSWGIAVYEFSLIKPLEKPWEMPQSQCSVML